MSDDREIIVLNGEQIDELVRCKDCFVQKICRLAQFLGNEGYCSQGERRDELKE